MFNMLNGKMLAAHNEQDSVSASFSGFVLSGCPAIRLCRMGRVSLGTLRVFLIFCIHPLCESGGWHSSAFAQHRFQERRHLLLGDADPDINRMSFESMTY